MLKDQSKDRTDEQSSDLNNPSVFFLEKGSVKAFKYAGFAIYLIVVKKWLFTTSEISVELACS